MSTEIFETITDFTATTLENGHKAYLNSLDTSKKVLQQQKEAAESVIEAVKSKADKVASAKDYQSFAAHSAELAQECGQIWIEAGKSIAETLAKFSKDCQQHVEESVKTANSNVSGKSKSKKSA